MAEDAAEGMADGMATAVRVDRLATAVEELMARVDEGQTAVVERVDAATRALVDATEQLRRATDAAEDRSDDRLTASAMAMRRRVEEVLDEVRDRVATSQVAAQEQLATRVAGVETRLVALDRALPELRAAASSIEATTAGLTASATGIGVYLEEAVAMGQAAAEDRAANERDRDELRALAVALIDRLDEESEQQLARLRADAAGLEDRVVAATRPAVDEALGTLTREIAERLDELEEVTTTFGATAERIISDGVGAMAEEREAARAERASVVDEVVDLLVEDDRNSR